MDVSCSAGSNAANLRLSRARAQSVVVHLVGKGVAGSRLAPRGFGKSRPVATNATDAARATNRRVAFRRLRRPGVAPEGSRLRLVDLR